MKKETCHNLRRRRFGFSFWAPLGDGLQPAGKYPAFAGASGFFKSSTALTQPPLPENKRKTSCYAH